ncbi:MAG TPA: hypothetical protein VGD31_00700, partial [Sphingobacteriaceae bacterium]
EHHLRNDLLSSHYTRDLFKQYKKHLGQIRYRILIESQKLVVPPIVKDLLQFKNAKVLSPLIPVYKMVRKAKLDWFLFSGILPSTYRGQIKALNIDPLLTR